MLSVFDLRAFRQIGLKKIKLFKFFLTAYLFSQRHSHVIYIHNVHCKPLSWTACIWKAVLRTLYGLLSRNSMNVQRVIESVKQFNGYHTKCQSLCQEQDTDDWILLKSKSTTALNNMESLLSQFIYLGQHVAISPLHYLPLKCISIGITCMHFHLSYR